MKANADSQPTRREHSVPNANHSTALNRAPNEWKTGDEPLTAAQHSYLETLATEAGERVESVNELTKAEASERIDELRQKTGRGS